jgi:lipopolysaccharide heptosyltransferase II
MAFDLQGLFKSGIQLFFASSRKKIGFSDGREGAWLFLDRRVPACDPDLNALQRYLVLAESAGAKIGPDFFKRAFYVPSDEDAAAAKALLAPLKGRPAVCLAIGTRWPSKLWPLAHFARLAELLSEKGIFSAILGSPSEAPMEKEILSLAKKRALIVPLCGKTSPGAMAAAMLRSEAVLSADSGPLHLAAAAGAKALALFGPTRPERTGPVSPKSKILRSQSKDCLGCLRRSCPKKARPGCMEDIAPERALAELMKLMES